MDKNDVDLARDELKREIKRLNAFIREHVPCDCGPNQQPMCKRCMLTDASQKSKRKKSPRA